MIRDIGVVLRGTLIAQALGLIALPLLSRLFPPEAFGHFAFYQSAILILTVVACLRYDQAILAARSEEDAGRLFRLCLAISLVVGAVTTVGALVVEWVLPNGGDRASLVWLGAGAALSGMALASNALLTRLAAFGASAWFRIVQSGANSLASVGLGFAGLTGAGLIVGDLIGKLAALPIGIRRLRDIQALLVGPPGALWTVAVAYREFPQLSLLGGLLNNGATFLAPAALYALFGAATAGQFALVDRAVSLPISLVLIAVSQVFTAQAARLWREGSPELRPYVNRIIWLSLLVAAPLGVLGALLAPYVFVTVFGAQWATAGQYAQLLAVMYVSAAVMGPVNAALIVMGRLRLQLGWEAFRLVLFLALWVTVFIGDWSPVAALIGHAVVNVLVNIVFVGLVYRTVRRGPPAHGAVSGV